MKEWYASFRQSKWFPLVTGVVFVVLGVIGILNPGSHLEKIALVAGVVFLLYGLLQIVRGIRVKDNTALRVFLIALGAAAVLLVVLDFCNLALVGKYLPVLTGAFLIVNAVTRLIPSFTMMKNGLKSWWVSALPAVIVLVLGFVFVLASGYVGKSFGIFAGIALLLSGVSALAGFFGMNG